MARQSVVRYAIAADLVIVATGVALLFHASAPVIIFIYAVAVAIAAWTSTWRGAILAIVLGSVALSTLFPAVSVTHVVAFIAASAAATSIVHAARLRRTPRNTVPAVDATNVVAMPRSAADVEARKSESLRRQELARSLERAAAEQLEQQRTASHGINSDEPDGAKSKRR